MLRIKNEAEESTIYISGDIIDDDLGGILAEWFENTDGYNWPADIKRQLDEINDEDKLTVYINSNGGSVPAGVAIANMIARHKGPTVAVVDGWACSIATEIFFAAEKRQIPANAYLMIHKPAVSTFGNADDLQKDIDVLNTIQEGMEDLYNKAAREDTTPEKIHEMVNAETWLTGKEAAEIFNVELINATETTACAGKHFDAKKIINMPQGLKIIQEAVLKQPPKDINAEKQKKIAIALALAE